jgi:hypothetical protein
MTWHQQKLHAQLMTVGLIKEHAVVSGGLAWHIMSPPHEENKYIHDHKDVDLFIHPNDFGQAIQKLKEAGFRRYWTKYDGITPNFYRYGLSSDIPFKDKPGSKRVKVLLDLFVENVPFRVVGGYKVVEPKYLLSLYGVKHASDYCWAVQAAKKLVAKGIDPVGRQELITEPVDPLA